MIHLWKIQLVSQPTNDVRAEWLIVANDQLNNVDVEDLIRMRHDYSEIRLFGNKLCSELLEFDRTGVMRVS